MVFKLAALTALTALKAIKAIKAINVSILLGSALLTGAAYSQTPPPTRPATGASTPAAPSAGASASQGATAQALTTAQLAIVTKVLAPYKPANLTADDAKLIKRTLRDSGLPRSPALDAAMNAAGFSPARLDQLDPPPPRPADGSAPPSAPAK